MDLKEIECECVDRIDLAANRDKWWAFVNMVMNICFLIKCGELLVQVCAYCAVVGVLYVMWDMHHLCPSSALKYRKSHCWYLTVL
jgi:succinate dehydrogenase/fumarate reductase cytochrome b subunit